MKKLNTGIFIFDGVEVLDFAGPFEVFSRTRLVAGVESRRSDVSAPFNVFTVARSAGTVHATGWQGAVDHVSLYRRVAARERWSTLGETCHDPLGRARSTGDFMTARLHD